MVDNTSKYPDWSKRDIKAKLKVELILLLHKHKFPPVANDDVYMGVLAQAEILSIILTRCTKFTAGWR